MPLVLNLNSERAKERAASEHLALSLRLERAAQREIERALNHQYRVVAEFVESAESAIIDRPLRAGEPELKAALLKTYRRAGAVFGEPLVKEIEASSQKSIGPAETKGAMADAYKVGFEEWAQSHAVTAVVGLSKVTRRLIGRIVTQGLSDGLSWGRIAGQLKEQGGFNKVRARRIARTEGHTAAVTATDKAVRAGRFKQTLKEWSARNDERTRLSHRTANAQNGKVDINQSFKVGSEFLMYPGDPSGSAANIVNCRCSVLYHTTIKKPGGKPTAAPPTAAPKPIAAPIGEVKPISKPELPAAPISRPMTRGQWEASLTEEEKAAINLWEEDLTVVNDVRLFDKGLKPDFSELTEAEVSKLHGNLYRAIDRAPKYKGLVFRGIKLDEAVAKSLESSKEIVVDALSSASKKLDVAKHFAGHRFNFEDGALEKYDGLRAILQLKTSTGVDVSNISEFQNYQEVLLKKGSRFRVSGVQWFGKELVIYAKEII